jgi:hypothetical protein
MLRSIIAIYQDDLKVGRNGKLQQFVFETRDFKGTKFLFSSFPQFFECRVVARLRHLLGYVFQTKPAGSSA